MYIQYVLLFIVKKVVGPIIPLQQKVKGMLGVGLVISSGFIYYEFSSKILIFWWLVVVFLLLEWINREFSI